MTLYNFDQLKYTAYGFTQKIKTSLENAGFTHVRDTGNKSVIKQNFEFNSGSYSFEKPDNYNPRLIEPFYQENQTKSRIGISPEVLKDSRPLTNFTQKIEVEGGNPPYTYRVVSPDNELEQRVTITAFQGDQTITQTFIIPISENRSALEIVTTQLPTVDEGESFEFFLQAGGGTGEYSWKLALKPPWLNIEEDTGKLFGTVPLNSRGLQFPVTVTVSDGEILIEKNFLFEIQQIVNVNLAFITPTTLPNAVFNEPYNQKIQLRGNNGTASLRENLTSSWLVFNPEEQTLAGVPTRELQQLASLPDGLELTEEGFITGLAPNAGLYSFTIRVEDSSGIYQDRDYSWRVTNNPGNSIRINNFEKLPEATLNKPYSVQLTGIGGEPPYRFQLSEGFILPPGLQISNSGLISGIPEAFSEPFFIHQPLYKTRVLITDSNQQSREKSFIIPIQAKSLETIPNTPGEIEENLIVQQTLNFKFPTVKKDCKNKFQYQDGKLNIEYLFRNNNSGTLTYRLEIPDNYRLNLEDFNLLFSEGNILKSSENFTDLNHLNSILTQPLSNLIELLKKQSDKLILEEINCVNLTKLIGDIKLGNLSQLEQIVTKLGFETDILESLTFQEIADGIQSKGILKFIEDIT